MPYSVTSNRNGTTYYLHRTVAKTPGGERTLHFFAKRIKEGAIDQVPEGYQVSESGTGLPVLKKQPQ